MTRVRTTQLAPTGATGGEFLGYDALLGWVPKPGVVTATIVTTKGDLIVGTGAGAVARLAAGAAGSMLTPDPTTATGLKWQAVPASGVTVQDENVSVGSGVTQLDFQGAGVQAAAGTGEVVITIPGLSVMDEGVPLTQRPTLDFLGAGVTATDDSVANKTKVTIAQVATFRNAWSSATNYQPGDMVTRLYSLWMAVTAGTNNPPEAVPAAAAVNGSIVSQSSGNSAGVWNWLYQPITIAAGGGGNVGSVDIYWSIANTTDTFRVSIASAVGANPGAITYLAQSAVQVCTGSATMQNFALGSAVSLAAGTTYYIIVEHVSGTAAQQEWCPGAVTGIIGSAALPQVSSAPGNAWSTGGIGGTVRVPLRLQTPAGVTYWLRMADASPVLVVAAKTANYAMTATDGVILASNTITVTLPPVASAEVGKHYTVKNVGTGTITIAPASGTLDGAANKTLAVQYSSIDVVTDGTNWYEV